MRFLLSLVLVAALAADSNALRIVTYNTATSGDNELPNLPRDRMATVLQGIGDEVVNGASRPIDVLLLQEQERLSTTTQAIVDILNGIYGEGVYSRGRRNGRTNGGGRGGIVYNTQTVELIEEASFGRLSVSAQSRETMRYTLRPVGYGEDANFVTYVNHYKAGSTSNDQTRRNVEATALRQDADALASSMTRSEPHFIFAGDFNIQRCTEDMFATLTSPGSAQAIDPVSGIAGCSWHDSPSLRRWHTQSPSDGAEGFLARGGIDDRFDFQLVTAAMLDGEGMSLIPDSYRSFGNNGTHRLNQPINDIQNTGASRAILNALARTSDHLPVVADYQIPAWMSVATSEIPGRIIKDTDLSVSVDVANVGPVQSSIEADELDFNALLEIDTTANSKSVSGEVAATETATLSFTIPTDEVRSRVYRLRVDSDSQGVVDGSFQASGLYTVVNPSTPSWSADETLKQTSLDLGIIAIDTELAAEVTLFNLATSGQTSDLETASGELIAPGASTQIAAVFAASQLGDTTTEIQFTVSDDRSVFGASEQTLSLLLRATVAIPGDVNLDGLVQFDDFLVFADNFGEDNQSWPDGDFDRDGLVQFSDFLALSENFGTNAARSGRVGTMNTPEPTAGVMLGIALVGFLCFVRAINKRSIAA